MKEIHGVARPKKKQKNTVQELRKELEAEKAARLEAERRLEEEMRCQETNEAGVSVEPASLDSTAFPHDQPLPSDPSAFTGMADLVPRSHPHSSAISQSIPTASSSNHLDTPTDIAVRSSAGSAEVDLYHSFSLARDNHGREIFYQQPSNVFQRGFNLARSNWPSEGPSVGTQWHIHAIPTAPATPHVPPTLHPPLVRNRALRIAPHIDSRPIHQCPMLQAISSA